MNLDASGGPMDAEEFIRLWDAGALTIKCIEKAKVIETYDYDQVKSVWLHVPTGAYWAVEETCFKGNKFIFGDTFVVQQVKPYVEVVEVTKYAPI